MLHQLASMWLTGGIPVACIMPVSFNAESNMQRYFQMLRGVQEARDKNNKVSSHAGPRLCLQTASNRDGIFVDHRSEFVPPLSVGGKALSVRLPKLFKFIDHHKSCALQMIAIIGIESR